VNNDLIEWVEIFSLRESPPASFSSSATAHTLLSSLKEILCILDGITLKFVDIDTSFKEIDEEQAQSFKRAIAKFQSAELEEDLYELYHELNLYLLIKDRFGEAADWNLKVEFDGRLTQAVVRSIHNLSKIPFI
jgi:hypothetical protein